VASTTTPAWTGSDVTDSDAAAWYTCQLGEFILPGISTLDGFDREQDVDEKKSKGKDGATLEDNGRVLAKGRVICEITAGQYPVMLGIMRELDPQKPGGVRTPRTIVHPHANEVGVTQIYVKKISRSAPTAAGGRTVTFDCIEWTPQPKKTNAKKKESESSSSQSLSVNSSIGLTSWQATQAAHDAFAEALGDDDFNKNSWK
jgi:hypothetical protein